MMKCVSVFLDLLFPPKCPICTKVQDRVGICAACEKELSWTEEKETLYCGSHGLRCAAPLWYEGGVRDAMLRLKFQGAMSVAEGFGEILARCAAEQFGGEFDTVTWVPVSRKRLRKRGYDQSRLLAQAACRRWDTKPVRLLRKTVNNPPQSTLGDAAARRANVLGVYAAVSPENLSGRRVLLVDDILTTGATLTECIRVLKDAGAADVMCVTVAKARHDRKEKTRE